MRRVAFEQGIAIMGVLGLIVEGAKRRNLTNAEAESTLRDAAGTHGLRISAALYNASSMSFGANEVEAWWPEWRPTEVYFGADDVGILSKNEIVVAGFLILPRSAIQWWR